MSVNDIVMSAAGAGEPVYVDDVFSTYVYAGNSTDRSIDNGIDLANKGGLVWGKVRTTTDEAFLTDTARGRLGVLSPSSTDSEYGWGYITSFNSNGFSLGTSSRINGSGNNYVSWTFRKAPKFFDVVTWTGNGTSNRLINHNLQSIPGLIIVKCTSAAGNWFTSARNSSGVYETGMRLNTTDAGGGAYDAVGNGWVSSTQFQPQNLTASALSDVNTNGATYVAYLFAHNAGGFGAAGTDNVISCGSFSHTFNGGNTDVSLGWEPQYLLIKSSSITSNWMLVDTMRGMPVGSAARALFSDVAATESNTSSNGIFPTATGFVVGSNAINTGTHIYMAIRRPMKPPTSGTDVFFVEKTTPTTNGQAKTFTPPFSADSAFLKSTDSWGGSYWYDRLRGPLSIYNSLNTTTTSPESAGQSFAVVRKMETNLVDVYGTPTNSPYNTYFFRRATGFMDVVCYTGTGNASAIYHNLKVEPELIIAKPRSGSTDDWNVYCKYVSADPGTRASRYLRLNSNVALQTDNEMWGGNLSQWPNASYFSYNRSSGINYVSYLFASCPGVSKVGTYTGNGSSQTINCGFSAGARFVMIKRTDSTGDWYVWDTARGIVSGNDPHLSLNISAGEVTTNDSIDPDSSGFIVNQLAATNINVNAASYIFLAIA